MTKLLDIDQMLDVVAELGAEDELTALVNETEDLADKIAAVVERLTGLHAGGAHRDTSMMGGTCVAFFKKTADQEVPEIFEVLDEGEEIELLDEPPQAMSAKSETPK